MKSIRWWRAVAVVALLAAAFLLPARPVAAATKVIYDDALATGWDNWSWAEVNLSATSPTHSGSSSIQVTYSAWSGLYLHHAGLSTAGYTTLRFFIHGGTAGGQGIMVCASSGCSTATHKDVDAVANAWTRIDIPLSDMGSPAMITDLEWQAGKSALDTLYIDDIALVRDDSAAAPSLSGGSLRPSALPADGTSRTLIQVAASDPQGLANIASISVDVSAVGAGSVALRDDGNSGDGAAGDGIYAGTFAVPGGVATGEYALTATATDKSGNTSSTAMGNLVVLASAGGSVPAALPQRFGWGTNEWSNDDSQDWQKQSGVPWDYMYNYITYEWYTDPGHWGNYVQQLTQSSWRRGVTPVISVYMMLAAGGNSGEGGAVYAQKLQNASTVSSYLAALQKAAEDAKGDKPVIFQLEPDFYGFMQQLSNDAAKRPAGVRADDPTSFPVALNISGYPNTLAGFGRRMVDVIRQTAPNVLIAPHASMWATNGDPNNGAPADTIAMAQRTADFMGAMGGDQADFYTIEWSDRDAGSGIRAWWDDTDQSLPRFTRALLWENALSARAKKRLALWQVPVGNMGLDNSWYHYQDNKAAYIFRHQSALAKAGVFAVLFGAGTDHMTRPSTDGGFVTAKAGLAYAAPAAPSGLTSLGVSRVLASFRWAPSAEADVVGYRLTASGPGGNTLVDVGPQNSATVLLPVAGSYSVTVAALDAQGNLSPASSAITVTTDTSAHVLFFPIAGR